MANNVDISFTGKRVVAVLDRQIESETPPSTSVDYGLEFQGQMLDVWAYKHDIRFAIIRSGKPVVNA